MDRNALAESLVRTTLSLSSGALRASYVVDAARSWPTALFAGALDIVCARAEQAEVPARETLMAIVDAFNREGMAEVVQRLREQAAGDSLLALERLVRAPLRPSQPPDLGMRKSRPPNLGLGREVTLGERKALARRPDRDLMQRLLTDPHPAVIQRCLHNPRITEDDVVRVAARRPGHPEVLAEIARSTWTHRPRVRMSLVLNPATPEDIAARISGLLLRPELELVARSPGAPASLRAICLEHLDRRPPVHETLHDEPRVAGVH
jgi:hypothetical protein